MLDVSQVLTKWLLLTLSLAPAIQMALVCSQKI